MGCCGVACPVEGEEEEVVYQIMLDASIKVF